MATANKEEISSDWIAELPGMDSIDVQCDLQCMICHNVLRKPIACQTCETPFCSKCITKWLSENNNKCPQGCTRFVQRRCPRSVIQQLSTFKKMCVYQPHGCNEVIFHKALRQHEEQCGYQPRQCRLCQTQMLKKDLTKHADECPLAELTCKDCNISYKRRDTAELHTDVICATQQQRNAQKHQEQGFAVPAKYAEFCKGRLCANCDKCRDWYFTGDSSTWKWIQSVSNWKSRDWQRWRDGKIWEKFERRDGYKCTDSRSYSYSYNDLVRRGYHDNEQYDTVSYGHFGAGRNSDYGYHDHVGNYSAHPDYGTTYGHAFYRDTRSFCVCPDNCRA